MEKTKEEKKKEGVAENPHSGHRDRMRSRLERGDTDSYQTHELVEMMLYSAYKTRNTNDIAHRLLKKFGSLNGIVSADMQELMSVEGVGKQAAAAIKNYYCVMRRCGKEKAAGVKRLKCLSAIRDYVKPVLGESNREMMAALSLDGGYNLIAVKTWEGTLNRINVSVREVAGFCYSTKAVGVAIAHSHPYGSPKPSAEDLMFTKMLFTSLKGLDITLGEHIVFGADDSYYSFNENNDIARYEAEFTAAYNPTEKVLMPAFEFDRG